MTTPTPLLHPSSHSLFHLPSISLARVFARPGTSSSSSSCVCTSEYGNGYAYYYSSSSPVSYSYTDTLDSSSYTVTGITVSMCGAPCGITSMTVTVAGISVGKSNIQIPCCCRHTQYYCAHTHSLTFFQYTDLTSLGPHSLSSPPAPFSLSLSLRWRA